ncbi:hypothetical protein Ahy_B06g081303 [Arachis hypogaea]|uniref:Endonuclease/exonuclease/phosphatase domain-containing protein n=1 Tax=Arachis hypogaea TaxID=3818 RepID=A0A444YKT1_ARAHY|nr:hypothetical protein Ahy_B06g081303 [Arachis hypogaea]
MPGADSLMIGGGSFVQVHYPNQDNMIAANAFRNKALGNLPNLDPPDPGNVILEGSTSGEGMEGVVVDHSANKISSAKDLLGFLLWYMAPHLSPRSELWPGLQNLAVQILGEYCVSEDFNSVLFASNNGGHSGLARDSQKFANCLLDMAVVKYLPKLKSDHIPILLNLETASGLTNSNKSWQEENTMEVNISNFSEAAKDWNKEVFGNLVVERLTS